MRTFVSRKITGAAAAIELGRQDRLYLGNLDAVLWGHAPDYVEGIWMILLSLPEPGEIKRPAMKPQKLLNVSELTRLGWYAKTPATRRTCGGVFRFSRQWRPA
jgi:hypothetical protein